MFLFAQSNPETRRIDLDDQSMNSSIIAGVSKDMNDHIWLQGFSEITRYNGDKFQKVVTDNVTHSYFYGIFHQENSKASYVVDALGSIFFIENDSLRPYPYNAILNKLNKRKLQTDIEFDASGRLHISFFREGYHIIDKDGKLIDVLKEKKLKINGQACIMRAGKKPFMISNWDKGLEKSIGTHFYILNESLEIVDSFLLEGSSITRHIPALTKLSNGNYFITHNKQRLHEFNAQGIVKSYFYKDYVINVLTDHDNGLWISTYDSGIHYYENDLDISKSQRKVFFKDTKTYAWQIDYEGGLWLYKPKEGLLYAPKKLFNVYDKESALLADDLSKDFSLSKNKMYVAHENNKISIVDIDANVFTEIDLRACNNVEKLDTNRGIIEKIYKDTANDRLWISKRKGIFYQYKDEWNALSLDPIKPIKANGRFNFCKSVDSDKVSLLASNEKRYFMVEDSSIVHVSKSFPSAIREMIFENDSIWVVTQEHGVYLDVKNERISLSDRFDVLDGMANYVLLFNNELWIALSKGIYIYNIKENTLEAFKQDGKLIRNAILSKQTDDNIWVFSRQGVFSIEKDKFANNKRKYNITTVQAHKKVLGFLRHISSNANSVFIKTDDKGILKADYADFLKFPLRVPQFSLNSLKINKVEKDLSDSIFNLKHDEGFLQIDYQGVTYQKMDILYRHRMIGLDSVWQISKENYVQYTTLPPGKYKFEIQAQFEHQLWGKSSFLYFNISPPFWYTWWFICSGIIVFWLLVLLIFRSRLRTAEKEKKLVIERLQAEQRALRAKMNPHFIFNVISSLQYLISDDKQEEATAFLEHFSILMRRMLDQSDVEYISIQNELDFLTGYIELEKLRLEDKFDYHFELPKDCDESISIPNLILQPIIENAIQHGLKNKKGKGMLRVTLSSNHKFLTVIIEDNGVGYNRTIKSVSSKNKGHKSKGLETIVSRIDLHNDNPAIKGFEIVDISDLGNKTGTRVVVNIKIKKNESDHN